jgi:hypothetical protein
VKGERKMNESIIAMEITKEEVELIIQHRKETARKERINELGDIIRSALDEIEQLGGSVHLPAIGGKYEYHRCPVVCSRTISVGTTKWG